METIANKTKENRENMKKLTIPYFQTETFGAVDGPGVRYVVFVQGCYYRCLFCHNPESWDLNKKVKKFTTDEIIEKYKHNIEFYKNGGITISGGDPTIHLDFLIELAKKCYKQNISLAIDTSGVNFRKATESKHKTICKYKPLWIVDIKQINPKKHKELVGIAEQREINLIKFLEANKQQFWVRQVLVPKYTDDKDDLIKLGEFIGSLKYMKRFELLPYHNMAIPKYKELNIKYLLSHIKSPTKKQIKNAMEYIKQGWKK